MNLVEIGLVDMADDSDISSTVN